MTSTPPGASSTFLTPPVWPRRAMRWRPPACSREGVRVFRQTASAALGLGVVLNFAASICTGHTGQMPLLTHLLGNSKPKLFLYSSKDLGVRWDLIE